MTGFVLIGACTGEGSTPDDPVDLTTPLGAGEVRAAEIVDPVALFGGLASEARPGDVLMVNDRVRFVVQGVRPGGSYLPEGGSVIDADIVRPEGVLGRDAVEDWAVMFGLGRMCVPESVEVVNDGRDGKAAVVRVRGYEGPSGLLEGALEFPGFVPHLGLEMVTEYVLEPDSWLLEVRSTGHLTDAAATFSIGDVLLGADEILDPFAPGKGFGQDDAEPRPWAGYVSSRQDVSYLVGAAAGEELVVSGYNLLTELASMLVGFTDMVEVEAGGTFAHTRYWGVGPDLATLTGALLERRGEETQDVSGVVEAPDGPVAGARVIVDVDGAPFTVAVTKADGTFDARVPPGEVTLTADGRGHGKVTDLPPGAAPISPYTSEPSAARALEGLGAGAVEIPVAMGRGTTTGPSPLQLGEPGRLEVRAADGLPFTVRVAFSEPDPPADLARVQPRPDGLAVAGWSRDGDLALPVEPGTYDLVVHRGPRFEAWTGSATVSAGQTTTIDVELPEAFAHDGWVLGDTHIHASPSPDGQITMEDRLVLAAASGLQVHFGTDHDHLADYRPLIPALGLEGVLRTVVSDEVSPPLRGHFNIYPVVPDPAAPNNGAWTWWTEIPPSTDAMAETLRERHGEDFVLQSNHPTDMGMASSAGWSPGEVSRGDFWTDGIQAMEVMNDGAVDEYLDVWVDLVSRGASLTPVAVSDSHGYFEHSFGFSTTWIHVGTDDPTKTDDDAIAAALHGGEVLPTNGPFLVVDPLPNATVEPGATIAFEARGASYVHVDRFRIFVDGVEAAVVEGTRGTFTAPDRDALIHVLAEGDTPMLPVWDARPWAFAGPWRLDAGGDGWTPPLPPLQIEP